MLVPCPECGGLLVEQNKQWAQCLNCEEQYPLGEIEAKVAQLRQEQEKKQEKKQDTQEKETQGEAI